MNERLEKETIRIWREEYAKVFNNDAYYFACLQNVAQHFYNLALEDVRKEVVDIREGADRYSEAHTAKRILNRIDKLKYYDT